jgi:anti-sigma regulatory factor (Ser/Thr protein kinase)
VFGRFPPVRGWASDIRSAEEPRHEAGAGGKEVRTSSVVHLPCAPASVALARRALSDDLRAAGVFDSAVRDAVLVISELLSNAILHAYPLPGERLQVAWAVDGTSVEVAVSDGGSATVPHAGHPSPSSINGRGLSIVEHLCQTWGIRADEIGLTVWAVVSAPRHNGSGASGSTPHTQSGNGDAGSLWRRADSLVGLPDTAP